MRLNQCKRIESLAGLWRSFREVIVKDKGGVYFLGFKFCLQLGVD